MSDTLSVVIPAYNRATLLPITLASLLSQERVADEILVVDDGSTDNTAAVAEGFGSPVRVIRQSNQGPGAARNRGLAEARGDFIHFFDSDDLALPNLHRVQLQALRQTKADLAYSPWLKAKLDARRGIIPTNHVLQSKGMPAGSLVRALLTNWSTVPMVWLVRRSVAAEAGGFPSELHCGEDQLFFLSLLLADARVVHTPSTLLLYRDDQLDSLSNPVHPAGRQQQLVHWARSLLLARHLCLQHGIEPADWFGFRRRASQALDDLQGCAASQPGLVDELEQLLHSSLLPRFAYRWSRRMQQKGEGLTSRLLGRRAHRSFRAAPLAADSQAACSAHLASLIDQPLHLPVH
jgi:glycosyltransferase involved in cell wall biosynthesis